MTLYPNHPDKHRETAYISPESYLEYIRSQGRIPPHEAPKAAILCYQRSVMKFISENHPVEPSAGRFADLLLLKETGNQVGVLGGFGVGAPAAALILEDLIAWGVRKVISIGTAGSLTSELDIGELVLCSGAIRDEGVSHHCARRLRWSPLSPVYVGPGARFSRSRWVPLGGRGVNSPDWLPLGA